MKLQFKIQPFQTDAVGAVTDLFLGQEKDRSTPVLGGAEYTGLLGRDYGVGNVLQIDDAMLLENLRTVQKRNVLPLSETLESRQFTVEMETGTGKTYVYTKTIFELNARYGFTKFIIVVPSVAIREGVNKSLEITRDHFSEQYEDARQSRHFVYNSARLSDIERFARSDDIQIMIINIDAFKKTENVINQVQDRLNGESAMRFVRDTQPVVIIDEPQSVDNTPKAKEAIASLNPLCVLRYSATHRQKVNLVYRLTPVDAYRMGLVKQISVSSHQVAHGFNQPYIRLASVSNEGGFKAKLEIDVAGKDAKVSRKTVTVKPDADLFILSGRRPLYRGYVVTGIDCTPGFEAVEFANTDCVRLGQAIGDIDENILKRAQIRRTIEAHFEKELRFLEKGIKVLSLFFIDEVRKYRADEENQNGLYADMFEACYEELLSLPKYVALKERFPLPVSQVHGGYFSKDKKGRLKDTSGDTQADDSTYNTIMKNKEWLLSFDSPLRFIFSHSALKEGWDNPNVFQVCTLVDQRSAFTCRQKIGRGLRLCVNQQGERIEDKTLNLLHVVANESFADFAAGLQKEIEDETGLTFGVLTLSLFTGLSYIERSKENRVVSSEDAARIVETFQQEGYVSPQGAVLPALKKAVETKTLALPKGLETASREIVAVAVSTQTLDVSRLEGVPYTAVIETEKTVSHEDAQGLLDHFETKGYVGKNGVIKDTMKEALRSGTLDLPQRFEAARARFEDIIARADTRPPLRDASKDVSVRLKKQAILSPEFMALWDRIKQKTTYRVAIDLEKLIPLCIEELRAMDPIPKARMVSQTAELHIETRGVSHTEREFRTADIEDSYTDLPDMLAEIGSQTMMERGTVWSVIRGSGRLADFANNPQLFTERCVEIIRNRRHEMAIDGISYLKLDGEEYYIQEIFDADDVIANLEKNAVPVEKSVYDHILYESRTIERPFALALDNDPDVKLFFKIPKSFKINTPIGTYNPDWAVLLDRNGETRLYFVLETKGGMDLFSLRPSEKLKIHCGKRHFEALDNGISLHVTTDWKKLKLAL